MNFNIICRCPSTKSAPLALFSFRRPSTHTHVHYARRFQFAPKFPWLAKPFKELRNANFLPPPRSEKLKIKTPFVGRRGPQARLAKPFRNLEMRFPPQKNKKSIFPPRKTLSTCLICKTFRNFEMEIFCPPGKNKNHDPLGRRRRQALFAKPFRNFEMQIFCPPWEK